MVGIAAAIHLAHLPFWAPEIEVEAVNGSNVALLIITLSVSILYDSTGRWLKGLPVSGGAAIAALTAARVTVAAGAAFTAIAVQAAFRWGLAGAQGWQAPSVRAMTAALWVVLVFLPWTVLAGVTLGRRGGAWAALALAVLATWLPDRDGVGWEALRWVLPDLAPASAPEGLHAATPWGHAVAHALLVSLASAAALRGRAGPA
jgi:hypothetical protein